MCNYGSFVAASSEKKGLIKGSIETLREMNVSEREIAEKGRSNAVLLTVPQVVKNMTDFVN